MATTSIETPDDLLTSTGKNYLKKLRETNDRPRPAVDDALGIGLETQTGGTHVLVPWDVDDHSVPTRVQHGYEGIRNLANPTMKPGYEDWGYIVQPVYISEYDRIINRGAAKQLGIWEVRIKNVRRHIRRALELVMFRTAAASGTHPGELQYLDFLSLNGADASTGFIEAAASGTNTLHNVAKASYPATTHPKFHNAWYNGAGSFSTNGLNGLYSLIVDQMDNNGDMNASDYRGYISKSVANHLKRALRSAEQYIAMSDLDDAGRMAMTYHGIKLTVTGRMPSTGSATTAAPWGALFVNWKDGVRFIGQSGYVMKMDPAMTIPGTITQAALFHLFGQFVAPEPGLCALLSNADAW